MFYIVTTIVSLIFLFVDLLTLITNIMIYKRNAMITKQYTFRNRYSFNLTGLHGELLDCDYHILTYYNKLRKYYDY